MDRLALIGDVVASVTYKPTATLVWDVDCLVVKDMFPDATTGEIKEYEWCSGPPWKCILDEPDDTMARQLALEWVFDNLAMNELHEVAEWMKVNGLPVFDPHAEEHDNMVRIALQFPSGEEVDMKVIP